MESADSNKDCCTTGASLTLVLSSLLSELGCCSTAGLLNTDSELPVVVVVVVVVDSDCLTTLVLLLD